MRHFHNAATGIANFGSYLRCFRDGLHRRSGNTGDRHHSDDLVDSENGEPPKTTVYPPAWDFKFPNFPPCLLRPDMLAIALSLSELCCFHGQEAIPTESRLLNNSFENPVVGVQFHLQWLYSKRNLEKMTGLAYAELVDIVAILR